MTRRPESASETTQVGGSPGWAARSLDAMWFPSERHAIAEHIREVTWQRWTWLAGFAFDLPALAFVYPNASWSWVLGLRVLGIPLLPALSWYARRPGSTDDRVAVATFVYGLAAVEVMALQGLALGGLESPWVLGALGFIFAGSLVNDVRGSRIALAVGSWCTVWLATLAVGSHWFPEVADQWGTLRSPIFHLGHWALLATVALGSVLFGQRIAQLQRELRAARQLASYRLQARIGVGGMNEVWLAWDERAKRNVALKILHRDPSSDAARRFQREAEALKALDHEHTVKVLDAGASDDGVMYIALEHLDGSDLEQLVATHGPLHPARAVMLMRQACASLRDAHARGIIHRDIKPSNLFLTRRAQGGDHLKVLDFGIARRLEHDEARLTLDGDAVGTPHFMAPETFLGAEPSPRVDVYGLGATLYFLLTGARPFEGKSGVALATAVASAPVIPPSERAPGRVPQALDALVMRALSRDLAERYASVDAFDEALAGMQSAMLDVMLDEGLHRVDPPAARASAETPTQPIRRAR